MENTNKDIENLELSLRSYRGLKRMGINTITDIIKYHKYFSNIRDIDGIGKKSCDEIYDKLALYINSILDRYSYKDTKIQNTKIDNENNINNENNTELNNKQIKSIINTTPIDTYISNHFYNIPVRSDYKSIYIGDYKVSTLFNMLDLETSEIFLIKALYPYISFKDIGLYYNITGTTASDKFKDAVKEIRIAYFIHKYHERFPNNYEGMNKYGNILEKVDKYDISNMYIITDKNQKIIMKHRLAQVDDRLTRIKRIIKNIHRDYKLKLRIHIKR